jgi:hypothetical protein
MTASGNEIKGGWGEPWQLAPDGVTERSVMLGSSVEGIHFAIEIRDRDEVLTWSEAYPTSDTAREAGYKALRAAEIASPEIQAEREETPRWPQAQDDKPAIPDRERERDMDIDR